MNKSAVSLEKNSSLNPALFFIIYFLINIFVEL